MVPVQDWTAPHPDNDTLAAYSKDALATTTLDVAGNGTTALGLNGIDQYANVFASGVRPSGLVPPTALSL